MLQLFLREPTWERSNGDDEFYKQTKSLLLELEQVIWSVLSSGGRSEARLWLCNTISGISSITPRRQRDLFVNLLRSKPIKRHLASQLLYLIFEKQPQKVGPIIAKESHKLENFFKGNGTFCFVKQEKKTSVVNRNPRHILQWFSNFSATGKSGHGPGAKALSQFAFINRDICWEELEWKGKHGQSPAMVATKPHYFLDLDVQRTVENFLEYVPEFWSSPEFSESLKDGSILSVDTKFFSNLFIDLMYKDKLQEVWELIEDFLIEQSFSFLCHHLLIILEEQELHEFLDMIPKYVKLNSGIFGSRTNLEWFEVILSMYGGSGTVDHLLLLNAVTNQGRKLMRLLQEEGSEEEKEKIKDLVYQLSESTSCANDLGPAMEQGLKKNPLEYVKFLGVHSWAIHFRLAEELLTPESWESLFISNGINFRKSDRYALVNDDEFSDDCGSDYDRKSSANRKCKKHKRHKKKRKRKSDHAGNYEDEFCDFDLSNNWLDLPSKGGDWLLSTDGYSTTWSSVDLPDHLSRHCFITWLKWAFVKWGVVS
ncbi:glutamyl-tRNA(Gln) amidotransferase subunit B [Striga asiatica]|uniref:Glutamyl-tRNA(Gln) amidotransferase subunit B n=1 Tax=Striga asiatica TaxID=4170 RepID=A0A5A7PFJ6_STRAF|nr:glutamyl-tRNA(Gln) amidotransferase subunit B [Striga asiatica]